MQHVIWIQQHRLIVVQECGNETSTAQHLSVSLSFYHSLDMVSQRELDLHRKLRGKKERNATGKVIYKAVKNKECFHFCTCGSSGENTDGRRVIITLTAPG